MVSSIGFGTTAPQTTSFQDLINKPQAYKQPVQAATTIYGKKEKNKAGKIVKGMLITAGAVAGGMVLAHKNQGKILDFIGKFNNEKINTATNKICDLGGTVEKYVGVAYKKCKDTAKEIPGKAQEAYNWCKAKIGKLAEHIVEKTGEQVTK